MYLQHFNLKDFPFRLTPDPHYLFMSQSHARAKAYMDYSLWKRDSFIVITGEIGSGKTTLIENLLTHADDRISIAKIHQTQLNEQEFLQAVLAEFGYKRFNAGKVELLDAIKTFLTKQHAQKKYSLIIVDEAQNLSAKVLEELRLLSDLETHKEKLVNVLLVGQPQLNDLLDSPGLEQLVQRVRLRFHLGSLTEEETHDYIANRLNVAGCRQQDLFDSETFPIVFQYTGGIPRLINILCDTALTAAFAEGDERITIAHVTSALNELQWVSYLERPKYGHERMPHTQSGKSEVIAKLVIKRSGAPVEEYYIDKRHVSIGRSLSNDVRIADKTASGVHAQIISSRQESFLIDLGSTNGTRVKGKKIKRYKLMDRDEFSIGSNHMVEFLRMGDNETVTDTQSHLITDGSL